MIWRTWRGIKSWLVVVDLSKLNFLLLCSLLNFCSSVNCLSSESLTSRSRSTSILSSAEKIKSEMRKKLVVVWSNWSNQYWNRFIRSVWLRGRNSWESSFPSVNWRERWRTLIIINLIIIVISNIIERN